MIYKKWLYHITHYSNLPSILCHGGLVANNVAKVKSVSYVNIAHTRIQARRSITSVPLPPSRNVDLSRLFGPSGVSKKYFSTKSLTSFFS
ncbi:DarT ssDNA thymidine ADP-ribosyltransferase family protein, partial [Geobacillus stearothermophilus]|nr:DarT ssDNA thymidine ADP-ribosyltransferase family protein [Geobacillus stearothermophilus]